ncbi:MAG: ribulose-phosphate 3-epimerase [Lachnospirales bacterium]
MTVINITMKEGCVNMFQISPSILACDFSVLGEQVEIVKSNGITYLHFDVMDGNFVPNISVGIPVLKSLADKYDMFYDVHLMIDEPIKYVDDFAKAGASLINIHIEACSDVQKTIDKIKSLGKKVGMTVKPNTKVEEVFPYLKDIDMVLVMTVEPGFGGQSFMEDCLEKVSKVRKYAKDNGFDVDIQVDGGVSLDTIQKCIDAGANVFVIGTKIFKGDIAKNCADFKNLLDRNK